MRSSSAFLHAEIQEVVVHKVSRVWEFRFAFAEVLPIALFKELRQRLKDEFSKTGNQATFTIQVTNPDFSANLLQAYYREVFEDGPCASQGFKGLYQDLQVRAEGQELIISGPSSVDTEHFLRRKMKRSSKRPMKRPCGLWNPWPRWFRHQRLKKSQPLILRLRRLRLNLS